MKQFAIILLAKFCFFLDKSTQSCVSDKERHSASVSNAFFLRILFVPLKTLPFPLNKIFCSRIERLVKPL